MLSVCLAASLFYVSSPVADMRERATNESEMVSQAIFSEPVSIIEETDGWAKIKVGVEGYEGWARKETLCQRQTPFPGNGALVAKVDRPAAHVYTKQDTVYGPLLTLPFESKLEVVEPTQESNSRWLKVALPDGREGYIQRGDISFRTTPLTRDEMIALSQRFLGLPYTWGGRSSFGYDCSSFIQMLYRQMGIMLPRDSKQQVAWEGFAPVAEEALIPGDVIFFGLSEKAIRHSVLYLGNGQFIHATVGENAPYIHISKLADPEWNGSGRYAYRTARTLKKEVLPSQQKAKS
jgi:SH3-like domain-containing protein